MPEPLYEFAYMKKAYFSVEEYLSARFLYSDDLLELIGNVDAQVETFFVFEQSTLQEEINRL